MIRQYAIDPACLHSWDSFCRFVDQIGICHGRLLAEFPSGWRLELLRQLKAAGLDQNNLKRIMERMATEAFAHKFFRREGAIYSTDVSWIENAVAEHKERPFDAVIAKCAHPQLGAVVDPDDITEEHPLWRVERTKEIKMSAGEIIGVVRPLIRVSREVLLIDPWLFGFKERMQRSILSDRHFATLRQLATECKNRTMSLVEYHCSDCGGRLEDAVVQEFVGKIQAAFPINMDFILCVWPKETQHNRLILTDVGGVIFGHGLDQCTRTYLKCDDVALLDDQHWKSRWNEYRFRANGKPSKVISVIKRR